MGGTARIMLNIIRCGTSVPSKDLKEGNAPHKGSHVVPSWVRV